MKRALITGIRGFAGSWLAAELLTHDYEVLGIDRLGQGIQKPLVASSLPNPEALGRIPVFASDLGCVQEIREIFQEIGPCTIFHLAGTAFVPDSWKSPLASLDNNAAVTLRLIEGAREASWTGRMLFVSSSDVYGAPPPAKLPITEDTPSDPQSPYALGKLTAEKYLKFYDKDSVEIVIARPFNHSGPGQRDVFVIPAFVKRVKEALAKGESSIRVGDIRAIRDFSDVRDVVRAYRLIAESGERGETYNICSGAQTRIEELLQMILALGNADLTFKTDPDLLRSEGASIRYGSPEKLRRLGWTPQYALEDTIRAIWKSMDSDSSI